MKPPAHRRPPITPEHCRHFGFSDERRFVPTCALGIDNTKFGAELACAPVRLIHCPHRQDRTPEEKRQISEDFLRACGMLKDEP